MSDGLFHARLRASSDRLFWLGLVMVVLGIAAVVFPMIFTLVAALLVGWVLLISGVGTCIGAFSIDGTRPIFGALLFGLLSIAAGIFMRSNPSKKSVDLKSNRVGPPWRLSPLSERCAEHRSQ